MSGCGQPSGNEQTRGNGGTEVMGPDADGQFYVVGFSGDVSPDASVTVRNTAGESVTVQADATGSWAAMLWSSIDKPVSVEAEYGVIASSAVSPQKVNVNFASRKGLEAVPGIGEALSQRILEYRAAYGLFSEISDLEAVDGIGPVSLAKMAPYVETKIDLNSASQTQLLVLPGIGVARASAIVAYREANGPYLLVSDLLLVGGISPNIYAGVEPYIRAGVVEPHPGATLVNVNKAGMDELMSLPGIGEGRAKAISDYRVNHGAFHSKEDLIYVPGIGPATLATIRDLVTVGVLDMKVGTFVAGGAWQYDDGAGSLSGESFPKPLLVKFSHSTGTDLLVTFVEGGYCADPAECAPFTLKGTISAELGNGEFSYRLSGLMPASGGDFVVTSSLENEGRVGETSILTSLVAKRGTETYRIALSGYRVIN